MIMVMFNYLVLALRDLIELIKKELKLRELELIHLDIHKDLSLDVSDVDQQEGREVKVDNMLFGRYGRSGCN